MMRAAIGAPMVWAKVTRELAPVSKGEVWAKASAGRSPREIGRKRTRLSVRLFLFEFFTSDPFVFEGCYGITG